MQAAGQACWKEGLADLWRTAILKDAIFPITENNGAKFVCIKSNFKT